MTSRIYDSPPKVYSMSYDFTVDVDNGESTTQVRRRYTSAWNPAWVPLGAIAASMALRQTRAIHWPWLVKAGLCLTVPSLVYAQTVKRTDWTWIS